MSLLTMQICNQAENFKMDYLRNMMDNFPFGFAS
jgi:hypothetical protein